MTAAGESIPIQGPQADPGQPISSNSNQSKKVSKSKTALQSICILSLIFGVVGLFVLPNTMFIHPIILSSGSFMVFGATSLYLLIYPSFNKLEKPKKNIDDKEKDQLCLFATQKIAPFIKPLNLSHRALDKYQIEDKNSEYTKSHWITQAGKEIIDISSPPTPTKTKNTTKTHYDPNAKSFKGAVFWNAVFVIFTIVSFFLAKYGLHHANFASTAAYKWIQIGSNSLALAGDVITAIASINAIKRAMSEGKKSDKEEWFYAGALGISALFLSSQIGFLLAGSSLAHNTIMYGYALEFVYTCVMLPYLIKGLCNINKRREFSQKHKNAIEIMESVSKRKIKNDQNKFITHFHDWYMKSLDKHSNDLSKLQESWNKKTQKLEKYLGYENAAKILFNIMLKVHNQTIQITSDDLRKMNRTAWKKYGHDIIRIVLIGGLSAFGCACDFLTLKHISLIGQGLGGLAIYWGCAAIGNATSTAQMGCPENRLTSYTPDRTAMNLKLAYAEFEKRERERERAAWLFRRTDLAVAPRKSSRLPPPKYREA